MTRPPARIAHRTGAGNGAAPARSAATAWPASSRFICATIARDAGSRRRAGGRGGFRRCCSDLALGLDHEAQAASHRRRGRRQADAEGARIPERIEQARPGTQFAAGARAVQARWSVSSRAAFSNWRAQRRLRVAERLGGVQRLGAHLADVVDPHQGAGSRAARRRLQRSGRSGAANGFGRAARRRGSTARVKAWSRPAQQAVVTAQLWETALHRARPTIRSFTAQTVRRESPRCAKTT